MSNLNVAFTLRIRLYRPEHDARLVTITAYQGFLPADIDESGTGHPGSNPYGWTSGWDPAGRVKLTCEVKHGSTVVFPAGQLYCALHGSSDSVEAKELVMSLVAMHPGARGGEGADYYAGYTTEQLAWVEEHGEALDMEREARYCDQNGNVRKSA